jgi:hypothetical protein
MDGPTGRKKRGEWTSGWANGHMDRLIEGQTENRWANGQVIEGQSS